VQHALASCLSIAYTFDLWMSKGTHDVFAIVVHFVSNDWDAKHVTIGLFKMINTIGATLAPKL